MYLVQTAVRVSQRRQAVAPASEAQLEEPMVA